ncbi:cysteine desulfurase IscS [Batrachochytrium salamandrivorans]|nr:cysteine desulfurase IscS [Batrachochytrium salamandrivorans]
MLVARSIGRCFATTPTAAAAAAAASLDVPVNKFKFNIQGEAKPGRSAFLDLQSTTPIDPRVLDAMLPWQLHEFGNPHSRTHHFGWEAEEAVEKSREQIAALIGANSKEIIFTSGATESNNLAIKGVANFYSSNKKHVITVQTEHKCVLDSCRQLETQGFRVTYLPVKQDGLIDLNELQNAIVPGETSLVSIMGVNNEIGVIQPLEQIGNLCRANGVFFHTDCAQMAGKVKIDVDKFKIDLLSISGHKIYGPKGVGALYVRRRPRVRLEAQMSGGGQERGLRSGTLAPFLIVGLGEACEIAKREMDNDYEWVKFLSDRMFDKINQRLPQVILNGHRDQRWVGNLNLSFAYVEGESLLMALKNIAVSSGSACTSASLEPSYVLRAIGVGEDLAHTSIRFGMGRFTTVEEVDMAIELCIRHVERLREMSPLWEMVQEGVDLSKIAWSQDH